MVRRINRHFAIALKQICTAVTVACWMIGVSLLVQIVAWSVLTWTDARYVTLTVDPQRDGSTEVLSPRDLEARRLRSVGSSAEPTQEADINHQLSAGDKWLAALTNIAGAVGTMGALGLLPLIGLGVVLAAGSATEGVEKTSGAFVWAVLLLALSLPWAVAFEQVPFHGIFTNYSGLTDRVDAYRTAEQSSSSGASLTATIMFMCRHGLLPGAALLGVTAIGLRFRAGVERGLMPREDHSLDPELEAEISKIRTTSLVGAGRSAGALHGLIQPDGAGDGDDKASLRKRKKSRREVEEEAPQRPLGTPSAGTPLSRPI